MTRFYSGARHFFFLWLLYFISLAVVATASLYVITPLALFFSKGELTFLWSLEPLFAVGRGVLAGSLALAIIMFAWQHFKK